MMGISACLVIHNEEKFLPRCLESIKDVVAEIIVVHDGQCSDKSLEIAKKFGAKIFMRSFIGEAEYHRPFAFEQAKEHWILQLDADEFLSEKAKKEIAYLINQSDTDAYSFLWPYSINNICIKNGPFSKTLKPCLFRKEKLFMIGISHEYPRTYGRLVKRPDILLEHQPGYNNYTKVAFRNKWINWAKLQANQIFNIEKASVFNINNLLTNPIYKHYLSMRNFPLLSGIKEMLKFIVIYLTRGILWSELSSWKAAYFELRYLWLVRIYLRKLNHGQRI